MPDDDRLPGTQLICGIEDEIRQIARVQPVAGRRAMPQTRPVNGNHAELARQQREQAFSPVPQIRTGPMQQDNRRPLAGLHHVNVASIQPAQFAHGGIILFDQTCAPPSGKHQQRQNNKQPEQHPGT